MIPEFEIQSLWMKQKSVDFDVYLFKASKSGMLRFLSHREWITSIERAMRRAQFPLWMTKGFHPKIKLDLNRALPTGMASMAEYFLVRFERSEEDIDLHSLIEKFNALSVSDIVISWGRKVFDTFSINKYAKYWEFGLEILGDFNPDEFEKLFSRHGSYAYSAKVDKNGMNNLVKYVCTEDAWVDYRIIFEEIYGAKYPDLDYIPYLKEVYWNYDLNSTLENIFD